MNMTCYYILDNEVNPVWLPNIVKFIYSQPVHSTLKTQKSINQSR